MAKKRVELAYITDDLVRKRTFYKRKKSLMKKARELSILCDINLCVIIYSSHDSQPEAWPSESEAQRVLQEFKTMPEEKQSMRMMNQETFLRQKIEEAKRHLERKCKKNHRKKVAHVMSQCLVGSMDIGHLDIANLNNLSCLIDQHIKDIDSTVENLKKAEGQSTQQAMDEATTLGGRDRKVVMNNDGKRHVKVAKKKNDRSMNPVDFMQGKLQQQWLTDFVRPQGNMGFGEEMIFPPFPDVINEDDFISQEGDEDSEEEINPDSISSNYCP